MTETTWCILRTSAGRTLSVASALIEAGYEAWTPTETIVRRATRSRKRVEEPSPITPSFVFVNRDRLTDLLTLSRSPSQTHLIWDSEQRKMVLRGIPHFSVFRFMGTYPAIADRDLEPLRRIERQGKPKAALRTFVAGDEVLYPDAGFEGLTGTVEGNRGRYVVVSFPGLPIQVKIDARHLRLSQAA